MDTELAAYLLNPSGSDYGVLRLAAEYGIAVPAYEDANVQAAAVLPAVCAALQRASTKTASTNYWRTLKFRLLWFWARWRKAASLLTARP